MAEKIHFPQCQGPKDVEIAKNKSPRNSVVQKYFGYLKWDRQGE